MLEYDLPMYESFKYEVDTILRYPSYMIVHFKKKYKLEVGDVLGIPYTERQFSTSYWKKERLFIVTEIVDDSSVMLKPCGFKRLLKIMASIKQFEKLYHAILAPL